MKVSFSKPNIPPKKELLLTLKKVVTSGWNLVLIVALVFLVVTAYKDSPVGGTATFAVSVVLLFHRFFLAYDGMLITRLLKEKEGEN